MDIIEKIKQSGVSVAELSEITAIPRPRIYKWLDGSATPKYEDSLKLEIVLHLCVTKPITE